jgi:hypothetical protein
MLSARIDASSVDSELARVASLRREVLHDLTSAISLSIRP